MFEKFCGKPTGEVRHGNNEDLFSSVLFQGFISPYSEPALFQEAVQNLIGEYAETMDEEVFNERILDAEQQEDNLIEQIQAQIKALELIEANRILLSCAKTIVTAKPPENSHCVWETSKGERGATVETCSNEIYTATITINDLPYGFKPWEVTVVVKTNASLSGVRDILVKTTNKRFDYEDEAIKFYESRKKFVTKKFFSELRPIIPQAHEKPFTVGGVHIPGYRYESDG